MTRVCVTWERFPCDLWVMGQAAVICQEASKVFTDAAVNTTDGYRFDFDDGWVHLRTSNTEPVMRIIVETETEEAAKKYLETIDGIRQKYLS